MLFEQFHIALASVFVGILLLDSFLVEPLFLVLFNLFVCLFAVLLEGLDIREDCSAVLTVQLMNGLAEPMLVPLVSLQKLVAETHVTCIDLCSFQGKTL